MHQKTDKQLKKIYDKFNNSAEPMQKAYIQSIRALVRLVELKDPDTKGHSVKVAEYAVSLAKKIGLPNKDIENIRLAALLHDIGKLGVRRAVLTKPAPLTGKEYAEIKKHPEISVEILKPLKFLSRVVSIVLHHHENYDGSGYPHGLRGERIPIGARILVMADVYDALTSKRAYRKAYLPHEAEAIMRYEIGKKFDPKLLKTFLSSVTQNANKKIKKGR